MGIWHHREVDGLERVKRKATEKDIRVEETDLWEKIKGNQCRGRTLSGSGT